MKKCEHCGVFIDESLHCCPLCRRDVGDIAAGLENSRYPGYGAANLQFRQKFQKKVLLFLVITVISICLLINMFSGMSTPWFLYVACPLLYALLLVNNTILSKMHTGAKILLQIAGVSVLLFLLDLGSGYIRWSVNIVIPFLFVAGTFLITIIMLKKRMLWSEYIGYVIALIFLGFLPVLLYLTGVSDKLWASAVSALYSLLTTIGMLLFSNKQFKNELVRRFHF